MVEWLAGPMELELVVSLVCVRVDKMENNWGMKKAVMMVYDKVVSLVVLMDSESVDVKVYELDKLKVVLKVFEKVDWMV